MKYDQIISANHCGGTVRGGKDLLIHENNRNQSGNINAFHHTTPSLIILLQHHNTQRLIPWIVLLNNLELTMWLTIHKERLRIKVSENGWSRLKTDTTKENKLILFSNVCRLLPYTYTQDSFLIIFFLKLKYRGRSGSTHQVGTYALLQASSYQPYDKYDVIYINRVSSFAVVSFTLQSTLKRFNTRADARRARKTVQSFI